jgi:hypothetical protein
VVARRARIASRCERFCPAELPAGRPQGHVVGFMELARELQVPISPLVLSEGSGQQTKVHAHVSIACRAVPNDLFGEGLQALIQHRGCSRVG